jgi:hypothetical protein
MAETVHATAGLPREQAVLEGQAAIDLWLRGKAAWNSWAEAHRGWTVSFAGVDFAAHVPHTDSANRSINFSGFRFPGPTVFRGGAFKQLPVNFAGAVFQDGYTDFTYCKFDSEDVSFYKVDFGNGSLRFDRCTFGAGFTNFFDAVIGPGADTSFHDVRFGGPLSFRAARFQCLNGVRFRGSRFAGNVDFSNVTAATAIDLRGTQFAHTLSLDNCSVGLVRHRQGVFRVARNSDDASCFRRLKQLAIDSKDHLREQDFFRKEQLAARHWETRGIALIPGFLYEWLSNFGLSILRPTLFLTFVMLLSTCYYYFMADQATRTVASAMLLALGQLPGVSSWSAEAKNAGLATLFGNLASVPFAVQAVALVQGVLSVVSLFLIGLGIRNRFRL